jgi:hypothetical protein
MSRRRSRTTTGSAVAALALALALCAAAAHATTEPSLLQHVKVVLTPSKISLSQAVTQRGNEVEFAVRNRTASRRVFSVAGKTIAVPAKALRLTAISFQARGRYRVVSRTQTSRVTAVFRVQ